VQRTYDINKPDEWKKKILALHNKWEVENKQLA